MTMEKLSIENKSQAEITKNLKDSFKNYETHKRSYDEELHELWKAHLSLYKQKIDNAVKKIEGIQPIDRQKYSTEYNKLNNRLTEARNNIYNKTIKLDLWFKAYTFHHDEHLNAIWAEIDNYENDAINTVNDLIDAINNEEQVQWEKNNVDNANKKRTYVEIDDNWIYKLTKYTNKPKIHEVLGTVIKPWELRKIDYSSCTNNSIKTKMTNAISNSIYKNTQKSSSCYLQYDNNKKTYVLSDWNGDPIPQRALIREWVQLTPPSKIKQEATITAKQNQQAQIDKINNIELSDKDQAELLASMPEKMRNRLKQKDVDEFFRITEESLNDTIKEAKQEWYELASKPISKYEWNWYLMKLNLINENAETSKPLIKNEFSRDIREAFSKWQLKKYLTSRLYKKWEDFNYLTKKWTVLQKKEDSDNSKEIDDKQKEFALNWLSMLWSRANSVANDLWNTRIKDDDREFAAIKSYIRDAENDINTQKITETDIDNIINALEQMLLKFFKNNIKSSGNITGENVIKGYLTDIIKTQDTNNQIIAMRKLWASRTRLDNSDTTFLRDEIQWKYEDVTLTKKQARDDKWELLVDNDGNPIYEQARDDKWNLQFDNDGNPIYVEEVTDKWIDLKDDDFEVYFQNIYKLYWVDNEDMIGEKKGEIDELYTKAAECQWKGWDRKFWKRLQDDKKLLPPHLAWHWGQWKDKIKELKDKLYQQNKNIEKLNITGSEIKERTKQELAELQLTLTSQQLQEAEKWNNESEDPKIMRLNALNFMLAQDDEFFNTLAEKELKDAKNKMRYMGVDNIVKWTIWPYIIRRWWWINSDDEIAKIYNDSVWAWGWLDFSDEWIPHVTLTDILLEIAITAVSIALSPAWAWVALAVARQAAKQALKTSVKAAAKAFLKTFVKTMAKNMAKKISTKAAKWAANATAKVLWTTTAKKAWEQAVKQWFKEMVKWSVSASVQRVKNQTLKSVLVHWTNLAVEWTFFHFNSTILHNAINWEDLLEWCDPFWYTEWPNWERIPNYRGYLQSIAFLWVLKGVWWWLQTITWDWAKALLKAWQSVSVLNRAAASTLGMLWEMWGMMATEQILSLTFDQTVTPITWESFISMIWMIVWLRFVWKCELKIKEYNWRRTNLEMKQKWTWNTFNVHMDGDGNVLKVEWKDRNWKKIQNPQEVLGIKQWDWWQNLRETHAGKEVWTVKWDIKQLNNLHEGDVITVKHWENDVKFRKNKNWNWEIVDAWKIENERFKPWEEYVAKENPDWSWYHLASTTEWWPKISLDWRVGVKLWDRTSNTSRPVEPTPLSQAIEQDTKRQEALRQKKEELTRKKESHEKRKWELEKKKAELERRRSELLAQREANWRSLDWQKNGIEMITEILNSGNSSRITIDEKTYSFEWVKNWKAQFREVIMEKWGKRKKNTDLVEVSSLEELLDSRFNLEPWTKRTNSWRYAKLNELIWEKVEPLDRLQNKIRNKKAEIKTLEEEIARLEKGENITAFNDYFNANKQLLKWKSVWIEWIEYRATHINWDWALEFKQVDWKNHFTISSFEQLTQQWWQWLWYSDWFSKSWTMIKWSNVPKASETANHQLIQNLINWEKSYFSSRNVDATITQKRQQLSTCNSELSALEAELPKSQARQDAIQERAKKWEEINKELRKIESELDWVNRELWEANRLVKQYQDELDWIEKELPAEEQERSQRGEQERSQREEQEEIENKITNIDSENWKFDLSYQKRLYSWTLVLKEWWINKWELNFSIRDNCIYIDGLVSFEKWSWTQLMKKLVEISESLWKWWHIEATASPYVNQSWQQSYREQKTNLWFYYKLWFKAKDPEIHKQIQEYINRWEEIPLRLNALTDIYLTDKWISDLKNTKWWTKVDYKRNNMEEQERTQRKEPEKLRREDQEKMQKEQQWNEPKNEKFNITADNFEIPLKGEKYEYVSKQTGKPPENITKEQAKECFFNWLDVTAQLMEWQPERAVLSSWSLFLNNPDYMKLWWDIDVATDVGTFRNVALDKWPNWKTKLKQFEENWKIVNLTFTRIDHTKVTLEWNTAKWKNKETGANESASVEDLIAMWDIRVEFDIPSKNGLLINCEFFPEPKWYWLIQLWTPRTEWKVNTYTINGKEVKTVNEELAAMSYMINLAHEIKNNSIQWLQKWEKIKDSIRINNFLQYLSSIGFKSPHDIINFIDKAKTDFEKQKWTELTINKDGETKTIDMSQYLKDWIDALTTWDKKHPGLKEILEEIESDYKTVVKTEANSRWTSTTISFNDFIKKTYEIKDKWIKYANWKEWGITVEQALVEIENLKSRIDIRDPQNFAYYYEIYQLKANFIEMWFKTQEV